MFVQGAFESVRVELNSAGINVLFAVPGPVESKISENAFTSTPGQVMSVCHHTTPTILQIQNIYRLDISREGEAEVIDLIVIFLTHDDWLIDPIVLFSKMSYRDLRF